MDGAFLGVAGLLELSTKSNKLEGKEAGIRGWTT